jgi:hypothetical protein
MGHLLGHAVRFGAACDAMAAGEGIETMLSLHRRQHEIYVAAARANDTTAPPTRKPSR